MAASKTYRFNHQIPYYECDASGHLTFSTLIALLILASERQNAQLGVDEQSVLKLGGGWVIIDYEAYFDRELPKENDSLSISTRILAYNKFFVVREFTMHDQDGHDIGTVKGLFVYMDLKKRRMAKIPDEIMAPYEMDTQIRLPKVNRPDKVTLDDHWHGHDYRVRYFDIDYNGHVNNAHYFDWMMDTLDADFLKTHWVAELRMNYEHEVRPDKVVASRALGPAKDGEGLIVTQHKIEVGQNECASATIVWKTN